MEITLRPATAADASALAAVHVASWRETYRGLVPDSHLAAFTVERRTERFRESLTAHAEETYLIESGTQLLGFLTLGECRDRDVDAKLTGEIWGIYLLPAHWRRGIGKHVVAQAEAMLVSRGRALAVLWVIEANLRARRFYEALGFTRDGATEQLTLGAPVTAIRYRKVLLPY